MWTRALLKENAKRAMRGRYWACFLACLVAGLLGGLSTGQVTNAASNAAGQDGSSYEYSYRWGYDLGYDFGLYRFWGLVAPVVVLASVLVIALAICYSAFVAGPISVGIRRYLMENRYGYSPFSTLFSAFQGPYLNVVKAIFTTDLRIFGWSLLFVIPGIYKSYQYILVPYLLAENPYMTPARARELSAAMTEGEKWNIFVLQLSFIGWELLAGMAAGLLTLGLLPGLGEFFILPYCETTYAELYAALRAKAFALGLSGPDELSDFVRHEA